VPSNGLTVPKLYPTTPGNHFTVPGNHFYTPKNHFPAPSAAKNPRKTAKSTCFLTSPRFYLKVEVGRFCSQREWREKVRAGQSHDG